MASVHSSTHVHTYSCTQVLTIHMQILIIHAHTHKKEKNRYLCRLAVLGSEVRGKSRPKGQWIVLFLVFLGLCLLDAEFHKPDELKEK